MADGWEKDRARVVKLETEIKQMLFNGEHNQSTHDKLWYLLNGGRIMGNKDEGLKHKYNVERTDGKAVGDCIVLEFEDKNAWPALEIWADTVGARGYFALAHDVREKLDCSYEAHKAIPETE